MDDALRSLNLRHRFFPTAETGYLHRAFIEFFDAAEEQAEELHQIDIK